MYKHAKTIIVLGTMLASVAISASANAQSMGFRHVDAYGNAYIHTEYYDAPIGYAPAPQAPARVPMMRYILCVDGYEREVILPYAHGRPGYEICPASGGSRGLAVHRPPAASPLPRRKPRRQGGADTARSAPATPPNYTAFNAEIPVIGGMTATALTLSARPGTEPRQERRSARPHQMAPKASNTVVKHVAKKLFFRVIPVVGTIVLVYEVVRSMD